MRSNKHVAYNTTSSLIFYPYFAQRYLSVVFFLASGFLFLCIILNLIVGVGRLLFVVLIVASLILAWGMKSQSRLCAVIGIDGIALSNGRNSFYAKWEDFARVYCLFDFKGHTYMLFATCEMDTNHRKKLIKQLLYVGRNGPVLAVNGNILLKVDGHESNISSIVGERLPFIEVISTGHGI